MASIASFGGFLDEKIELAMKTASPVHRQFIASSREVSYTPGSLLMAARRASGLSWP